MANSEFITIQASTTTGILGALPRIPVLVTRESVSGFSPDSITGLIKINSTDQSTFEDDNPTAYGLINALNCVFEQAFTYPYIYILSTDGDALTSGMLDQANIRPRDWSFLTLVSQYQGGGTGAPGGEFADYFDDLLVMSTWATTPKGKIVVHTYSTEESAGLITIPSELALGSTITSNDNVKTIICNSQHTIGSGVSAPIAYDNISLAWLTYCINTAISRSWGSLSDAHDFEYIDSDSYTIASHNLIENASLAQYNGAKDRAGSLFVYDTQMDDDVNPPLSMQIESLAAVYYIEDYTYVLVHNTLQAAGQTGVPNDDGGIQLISGLVTKALQDCFGLNLILGREDGSADFTVKTLTAAQVTILSPNWQTTGIWPSGVITATVRPFSAAHYVTINFNFL